jgi:SAM-dependent methyltransferase
MKLNLACGLTKLEGYVNVDVNPEVEPDMVLDVAGILPWKDGEVDEVVFFHAIEHIEKRFHLSLLSEFHRILGDKGRLVLGYPEFSVCLKFWLDNFMGKRAFWENCIFGRQLDPKDFHVCAMHTPELKDFLLTVGFEDIETRNEENNGNPQYTVLRARKGVARPTYEDVLTQRIFGDVKKLEVNVADVNKMVGN